MSSVSSVVASSWSAAFASSIDVPFLGSALGSNNWVVDGTMTASGRPLLANDPHLEAQIPSLWYLAQVSGGDFDAIGATLPGAPAIVIGRNRFIAWGETNVMGGRSGPVSRAARCDGNARGVPRRPGTAPYRERNDPGQGRCAGDDRSSHLASRSADLRRDQREQRRVEEDPQTAAARPARVPLDGSRSRTTRRSLRSCALNEAQNWTEFTTALRDFVVPSQNFVYADVDGHIGYYAPGRFPIRAPATAR